MNFTVALLKNGALVGWGDNEDFQFGEISGS